MHISKSPEHPGCRHGSVPCSSEASAEASEAQLQLRSAESRAELEAQIKAIQDQVASDQQALQESQDVSGKLTNSTVAGKMRSGELDFKRGQQDRT